VTSGKDLARAAKVVADAVLKQAGLANIFYQLGIDRPYRLKLPKAGEYSDIGAYLPLAFSSVDCVEILPLVFGKNGLNIAYYRWSLMDLRHFRDDRTVPGVLEVKDFVNWINQDPQLGRHVYMLVYLPRVRTNTLPGELVDKSGAHLPGGVIGDDHYYAVPLFVKAELV